MAANPVVSRMSSASSGYDAVRRSFPRWRIASPVPAMRRPPARLRITRTAPSTKAGTGPSSESTSIVSAVPTEAPTNVAMMSRNTSYGIDNRAMTSCAESVLVRLVLERATKPRGRPTLTSPYAVHLVARPVERFPNARNNDSPVE